MKKFILLFGLAAILASCNKENYLTPDSAKHTLSDNPVALTIDLGDVQTKATTTASDDVTSLYVNAYSIDGVRVWNTAMTRGTDGNYTAEDALWTKWGKMHFYAAYPADKFQLNSNGDGCLQFPENTVYPLTYDPVVGYAQAEPSSENTAVSMKLYHIASQVKMSVTNNSNVDVRVHGDLVAFYKSGTFKWKSPASTDINGQNVSKLPANCWTVQLTDNNQTTDFCAASIGSTVGSTISPLQNGQSGTLLTENIVPLTFMGGEVPGVNGPSFYPHSKVVFTVYWSDGGVDKNVEYEYDLPDALIPGVQYNYHLALNGGPTICPVMSTTLVDDISVTNPHGDENGDINVDPWSIKHTLNLSVNDETRGTVTGSGEYGEGEDVTITANALDGYTFIKWSDGNTNASRSITMGEENINLTAIFYVTPPYYLYAQLSSAWSVSNSDKFEYIDNFTFRKVITFNDSNKASYGAKWGFIVPTGTSYSAKVINNSNTTSTLTDGTEGDCVLLSSSDTYRYFTIPEDVPGTYIIEINVSTMKYIITLDHDITWYKEQITNLTTNECPNYIECSSWYTESSYQAFYSAYTVALTAIESDDKDAVKSAYEALVESISNLATIEPEV